MASSPQRTCIACRRKAGQDAFFRIGKDALGVVTLIEHGPSYSRSAYLCRQEACVEAGFAKDRLRRALRLHTSLAGRDELLNDLTCRLKKKQTQ